MARTGSDKNFYIWDELKHTDPKYTKPFSKFGGKTLTTIDPMYQVMCMTGKFGPIGKGWRFKNTYSYTDQNVLAEVFFKGKKMKRGMLMGQYQVYVHYIKRMADLMMKHQRKLLLMH